MRLTRDIFHQPNHQYKLIFEILSVSNLIPQIIYTMRIKTAILAALLSFCTLAFAQQEGNTQISGTINNAIWKQITLKTDESYKSNTQQSFDVRLNSDNEFLFMVPLTEPQFVLLLYGRNEFARIYVEPGDAIHITCNATGMAKSMTFSGTGSINNQALKQFWEKYPPVSSKFAMTQYKKGVLYYDVAPDIDDKMKRLGQTSFTAEMRKWKDDRLGTLSVYESIYAGMTPRFIKHMRAEVEYAWAYNMLLYGYAFGVKHGVMSNYFDFAMEVLLNDDDLVSNENYRRYVKGFLNYKYDSGPKTDANPYIGQYNLSKRMLNGKTQAYFQSDIIVRGLRKTELHTMLDVYNEFVMTTPYYDYSIPALDMFYEKNLYANGSPAPQFTMVDINGNQVSLYDYLGKNVYLDFWATWCAPCIRKMEITESVKRQLNRDDIVFIHISLERTQELWQEAVINRNINGINLYADAGMDSAIIKTYNVKAIPEYFIIDKNGNFVRKPKQFNSMTIKQTLETLH